METEKKIDVDQLIKGYASRKSADAKKAYLAATVKTQEYLPFEVVCVYADNILKTSYYDKDGNIRIDSCKKYLMYIFVLLSAYTNVAITEDRWMLEYNKLNKNGLIEELVKLIPEGEVSTLDAILKMKTDDFMTNEFSSQAFWNNQLAKVYPFVGKAMDTIVDMGEDFLKNVDMDKMKEMVTKDNK